MRPGRRAQCSGKCFHGTFRVGMDSNDNVMYGSCSPPLQARDRAASTVCATAFTLGFSGATMLELKRYACATAALFTIALCGAALAQNAAVTVNVDANANRHAISPYVYGIAYGSTANLTDLNAPLNRYGGNNTSRYNWQQNADNRAADWYFESIGEASAVAGERGDTFIGQTKSGGAQP